ncbi:MAG: four helix bundle protein [Desulfobacterales bacterium]|nr:four helix bundle protein [Desulfobacterales bacterium]
MYKVSKPPIWREANRLLLEIEQAVRCFPRYHKYATGGELRRQAMVLCQRVSRALSATGDARLLRVRKLLNVVDDLKIAIQQAKALQAFSSFAAFQRVAELAVGIGKQGGAWMRHLSSASARPESRKLS